MGVNARHTTDNWQKRSYHRTHTTNQTTAPTRHSGAQHNAVTRALCMVVHGVGRTVSGSATVYATVAASWQRSATAFCRALKAAEVVRVTLRFASFSLAILATTSAIFSSSAPMAST